MQFICGNNAAFIGNFQVFCTGCYDKATQFMSRLLPRYHIWTLLGADCHCKSFFAIDTIRNFRY